LDAHELYDLLFQPGFSTRAQVSEMSGRGVGMDVVRSRMQALSGLVEIDSRPGGGTAVTLTLPVQKSIMQVLAVDLSGRSYAVPLESILEVRPLSGAELTSADDNGVVVIREREVPLLDLRRFFGLPAAKPGPASHLVAVALGARAAGLVVDGLQGRRQAVIRPFDGFFRQIPGLAAVAELDDARPALMLDVGGLLREVGRGKTRDAGVLPDWDEDRRPWSGAMAASVAVPDGGQLETGDPATVKPDEAPAICPPPLAASRRLLTFFLAGREYGLDIREIIEIIDTVEFNPLPCAPAAVRGVVIWRDQVVPVLDACLRMGIGETSPGRFGKMILCRGGDQKLGILVERLGRLIGEPFEEVPVTEPSSGHEGECCTAGAILAHGRKVTLLRTDRLVEFPACSVKEG
jgi:chemotaxis signal transduction protein